MDFVRNIWLHLQLGQSCSLSQDGEKSQTSQSLFKSWTVIFIHWDLLQHTWIKRLPLPKGTWTCIPTSSYLFFKFWDLITIGAGPFASGNIHDNLAIVIHLLLVSNIPAIGKIKIESPPTLNFHHLSFSLAICSFDFLFFFLSCGVFSSDTRRTV